MSAWIRPIGSICSTKGLLPQLAASHFSSMLAAACAFQIASNAVEIARVLQINSYERNACYET
jgi:hypothetical protein